MTVGLLGLNERVQHVQAMKGRDLIPLAQYLAIVSMNNSHARFNEQADNAIGLPLVTCAVKVDVHGSPG